MSLQTDLDAQLVGFAALTALVETRIHWGTEPQNTGYPSVQYHRVDENRPLSMGITYGLTRQRWQFDVRAQASGSLSAGQAAQDVIDQVVGALDAWTTANLNAAVFLSGGPDFWESNRKCRRMSVDFEINYWET